jgi:hypothetical protein
MTSELIKAIVRAENLLTEGEYQGVERLLEIIRDHAQSAELFLNSQSKSMAALHFKIKELAADAAMHKERMEFWEKRARSCESELED